MVELRLTSPATVRAVVAAHVLGNPPAATLGEITLLPHQVQAVQRLARMLMEQGGALLADDVGLGKSFVALALARAARAAVIVAPAATRGTWLASCRRAGVHLPFISVEAMARHCPALTPDLVIVDEAHHLRNPSTRRFANVAALCRHARVLLLSATPVQNTLDDCRTLLSLFLGQRAFALAGRDLGSYCVRRDARNLAPGRLRVPTVREPAWLPAVSDAECLERILALPPPLPPIDGAEGGILLSYTLVRQWSSSRAALRGALLRRVGTAMALEDALAAGRHPTRRELLSWSCGDGVLQLAFPELVAAAELDAPGALLAQVRRHAAAVRELLDWLDETRDPDLQRAETIASTLRRHEGERAILFSEYTDTVKRLYRLLAGRVRCAMLTHRGGHVAGGPVSRRELLACFDPAASPDIPASDRIDLLLTTDVLSEGVNLHAASIVIHGDLTWNPARLQQRVGRLRRLGAVSDAVHVYLSPPPAAADRLLGMEPLLRRKLALAAQAIGLADAILPGRTAVAAGPLASHQVIIDTLSEWHAAATPDDAVAAVVDGADVPEEVALVCVRRRGAVELLVVRLASGVVTDRAEEIMPLVRVAGTGTASPDLGGLLAVRRLVERHLEASAVTEIVAPSALLVARARRDTLRRIDAIARRAQRSMRSTQETLVGAARAAASATLPAGTEATLALLSSSTLADDAWLREVGTLAARQHAPGSAAPAILAVLLLRP